MHTHAYAHVQAHNPHTFINVMGWNYLTFLKYGCVLGSLFMIIKSTPWFNHVGKYFSSSLSSHCLPVALTPGVFSGFPHPVWHATWCCPFWGTVGANILLRFHDSTFLVRYRRHYLIVATLIFWLLQSFHFLFKGVPWDLDVEVVL